MGHWSCVFCELLRGVGPAVWLAREDGAAALLPLPEGRLASGHVLVISTEHAVGIQDVSEAGLRATVGLLQRVAQGMGRAMGATGVNVLNASGPHSDQSVPHLHFHVVPRWAGDGLDSWPSSKSSHVPADDWMLALRSAISASDWTRTQPPGVAIPTVAP